ncbi:hypothetical protein [Streptomyces sp. NPDC055189]
MSLTDVTRRRALTTAVGVTAAVGLASAGPLAPIAAAAPDPFKNDELKAALRRLKDRRRRNLTGRPSANRWDMQKAVDAGGDIAMCPVPGTMLNVAVRKGDTESILVHVIRRFHYEVDELREGDVIGWRAPGTVRKGLPEGNQASGTAVQIRPGHYPTGVKGGFFLHQEIVIRDILGELEGTVRWAGDDPKPDESLFYIDVPPGDTRLNRVAAKLRGWREQPGKGAGGQIDVLANNRRNAAKSLMRQQSR